MSTVSHDSSVPMMTPPPRGPQTRMSGEDRRQQIVRIAMRRFSEKGFNGVTTKEIAAEAGISEAMIFRHFATKQELYSAIIDHKAKDLGADEFWASMRELAKTRDDRRFFETLMRHIIEKDRTDFSFVRLLFFSALEGHELSEMFFETRVQEIFGFMGEYIESRIREGAFRRVNPRLAARCLFAMPFTQMLTEELFRDFSSTGSTDELARTFADMFLAGIRADADPNRTTGDSAGQEKK